MSARAALRRVFGGVMALPAGYAVPWLVKRADAEHLDEVERERGELLAWAADRACECGPGDEGSSCVEDDPVYRCWPCAARERLDPEEHQADANTNTRHRPRDRSVVASRERGGK